MNLCEGMIKIAQMKLNRWYKWNNSTCLSNMQVIILNNTITLWIPIRRRI